jgi:lysophospholipase L1-like esterase
MERDGVAFHNVAAVSEHGDGGLTLQRVPDDVWAALNDGARERMRRPAGVELRFRSPDDAVQVTLSAAERTTVVPFFGPFQGVESHPIGPEPTTITVRRPAVLDDLHPGPRDDPAFDPAVWRLRFGAPFQRPPVRYHGVAGDVSPPNAADLPDRTYLAYGTSITEGVGVAADHRSYVATAARALGADAINLGTGGSAYCEAELADHVAAREDWDVASLALSVNMLGAGFSLAEFTDRARYMVETVGATGRPVAAVTLFPFTHDLADHVRYEAAAATPDAFRAALRDVVAAAPSNVRLVEGTSLLDPAGLTADLTHPGDAGAAQIGRHLAAELGDDRDRPL